MKKRKLNKKRIIIFILIVACTCSSLVFCVASFAKYVTQDSKKTLVIPADFQFSSNYLKETNTSYSIYDWDEEIIIELYNIVNLNKSEVDIPYSVSVSNGTSNINNGVLTTEEETDTIIITPTHKDIPVVVSVSSNTYDYTLSATFNFVDVGNNSYYTFVDKGNYSELLVNTNSSNVNALTVNWDSSYAPDNTNPLMETWTDSNGVLSLSANTEYVFIFFENAAESHPSQNGIITENAITLP